MVKLVLASESPRRTGLLRQIGLVFDMVPSGVDEQEVQCANPKSYVKKLAKLKSRAVAKKMDEGIIIGADTVVCVGKKIFGKPKDKEDAVRMLKELDGKVHEVISGLCIINKYSGEVVTKAVTTKVKFRTLNDELINWYVGTGEPLDKAGGYGIQGKGAILVEWIKGDYFNVVGLPLATLSMVLEKMGAL